MYAVFIHAHQKIDRLAIRQLRKLIPGVSFPTSRQVLHFEGKRGPDATKLKKSVDCEQPWHFIDPYDISDTQLGELITAHEQDLVQALRTTDMVRAGFEAAWLAHALVDGLTPAHHYPYEQELSDLRDGAHRESRNGLLGRAFVRSGNFKESLVKSFQLIGPKGLLTNHTLFEAGVYMIMMPIKVLQTGPTESDIKKAMEIGLLEYFQVTAREIAHMDLFNRFCKTGWTPSLVREVRKELAPRMINTVTIAWYIAAHTARNGAKNSSTKAVKKTRQRSA